MTSIFEFSFSTKLKEDIRTTGIWAMITAIISFITTAITLVKSLMQGSFFLALVVAAINVTVGIYLLNFGIQSKKGIETVDQGQLEEGLNNLRMYFKVWSILLIIALSIIFLVVFFAVITRIS